MGLGGGGDSGTPYVQNNWTGVFVRTTEDGISYPVRKSARDSAWYLQGSYTRASASQGTWRGGERVRLLPDVHVDAPSGRQTRPERSLTARMRRCSSIVPSFSNRRGSVLGLEGAVGIAIRYGLDGPGIESRWGQYFRHQFRSALGPNQPSIQSIPGHFRG
jgi:hypothetical protein